MTVGSALALVVLVGAMGCAREPVAESNCAQLAGWKGAGVEIRGAAQLAPQEGGPRRCEVAGLIDGTIQFELLLPEAWNGKFLMGGGGGFVGAVTNQARAGLSAGPRPLARGYATAGTDTGHTGSVVDATWALNNPQAEEDFAHRAVHRTAVVSKAIIREYYEEPLAHSYFLGCSRGGGQGMISAQRYPEDFDGIVVGAPALHWTGMGAGFIWNQQANFPNSKGPESTGLAQPLLTRGTLRFLGSAVRSACDELDGVADGVLNDPRKCSFRPEDLPRCEADVAADCVTAEQLAAIQAIYSGPRVAEKQIYPGFPFGAEGDRGGWARWITGANRRPDLSGSPNISYALGTQLYKYLVFDDPDWDYAGYDFANWHEDTASAGMLLNATDPNLRAFRDGGGKLILWHGWSDAALTALYSIDYYERVERLDPELRQYFRMFLLPGVGHCGGGPGPGRVDWITALERWVEEATPPERLLAAKRKQRGRKPRIRPLCPYPQVARYDGSGNPDVAESYHCEFESGDSLG